MMAKGTLTVKNAFSIRYNCSGLGLDVLVDPFKPKNVSSVPSRFGPVRVLNGTGAGKWTESAGRRIYYL
jgi:hypothetical protein